MDDELVALERELKAIVEWLKRNGAEIDEESLLPCCPQQICGWVNGIPFYYRVRHGGITLIAHRGAKNCDDLVNMRVWLDHYDLDLRIETRREPGGLLNRDDAIRVLSVLWLLVGEGDRDE